MKKSVFKINTKGHMEKDLFFDEGVDVARYDIVKYPQLQKFFMHDTKIYGTKISFGEDKFKPLSLINLILTNYSSKLLLSINRLK